jgi:hypothetical protein
MALVPHKVVALNEFNDSEKQTIEGAVVSLYDTEGNAVTLFDSDAGANGSTSKQTDAEGVVVVYVTPGEYDEEVNGGIQRRVLIGNQDITTQQLIERIRKAREGDVITTTGFYEAGDTGAGSWLATGTTGVEPSLTPSDRGARELTDGSGRLWKFIGVSVGIEALGGHPSLDDNAGVIKAAASGGNIKVTAGSGVFLSSGFDLLSNTTLKGSLSTTIKSVAGNTGGFLLARVNGQENVTVSGITFDGNFDNITTFNNTNLSYNSSKVRFEHCEFINCRGIALFAIGGNDVGVYKCSFTDCGIYNLTSGDTADRKQAFACSGVEDAYAKNCDFNNIGLDCISFATNCKNVTASGNKINTNYAGSIYVSSTDIFKIYGNTINNNVGGNGVDCYSSTNGEIFGNHCFENGASGILAANCSNVEIYGNECWNNFQVGTSVHRGGITISANGGDVENINVHGNSCYDNQGEGNVTQRYSVGVYTSGSGTYKRVKIDASNNFRGYGSSGALGETAIFQNADLNAVNGHVISFNLEDQSTVRLYDSGDTFADFSITQVNQNSYASFYTRKGASPSIIDNPQSAYVIGDSGTSQAVYLDGDDVLLKNRTGQTRTYIVKTSSIAFN